MAIGAGWVDGAWVDAGWVTGAWEDDATISVALSGTALGASWETIRDSGATIIITLTNDTFIPAGTGPIGTISQSDVLTGSFTAAASPTNGWNNEISLDNTNLVRTSDTVATITIPATASYDPQETESISGIVQSSILTTSTSGFFPPAFNIMVGGHSFNADTVQSMVQNMTQSMVN